MSLIFADLEPLTALVLFAASFVGSFITVSMGLGGGVMMLAIMASLLPPAALIPVHGVIQGGSNLNRALVLLPHVHWAQFWPFVAGGAVGVVLGGVIAVDLPAWAGQIGVGLFIIWSVLRTPPQWMVRFPAATGAVSSFLTMFFGATGPFVASYIKSLGLNRKGFVATHAVLMTLQHMLKVIVFGLLGFGFAPWIGFILVMIGMGFLGTLVGKQVLNRMTDNGFKWALNTILLILALRLIWQGGSGWWGR